MCVCMSVSVYVRTHVCMYVCMYVWLQVGGVRCSGPDVSDDRRCRYLNVETCQEQPCSTAVSCTDLPHKSGSYCGDCPTGLSGNGNICRKGRSFDG